MMQRRMFIALPCLFVACDHDGSKTMQLRSDAPPPKALYAPSSGAKRRGSYAMHGRQAPELAIAKWTEGSPIPTIADGRGKVRHIYAFQGFCPACQSRGFPVATTLDAEFSDAELEVIYVQTTFEGHETNDFERAQSERAKWKITGPVGHDQPADHDDRPWLMKTFRTGGTPWTIVLDPWGRVRFNDFTRDIAFHKKLVGQLIDEALTWNTK